MKENTKKKWHPFSWENCEITQGVHYQDTQNLEKNLDQLKTFPPLVTEREIKKLKKLIHNAESGRAFILQGGDCSELFSDCNQQQITYKFKILLQMSIILIHSLKKPVIRIGRIAGQYAKPRSVLEETIDGVTLPTYRGDIINGHEFTLEARTPNPDRLLQAYQYSSLTLNYLRALASDGFADLHHSKNWQMDFKFKEHNTENIIQTEQLYKKILDSVTHALQFFESALDVKNDITKSVELFTSHEALHLPYEAALTREIKPDEFYNLSTHFPWVGMRTLSEDKAHVEYLRGIENPIGIKVGPNTDLNELMNIILMLNPRKEHGKIVLIHRFGTNNIAEKLPLLLNKLTQEKIICAVICDPMHGNTRTTKTGIKTRYFDDILAELCAAFTLHKKSSIPLAGIHFEMTGDNVTECIGGSCGLKEEDLEKTYTSLVDPRLNYQQSLEIVLKIAALCEEH